METKEDLSLALWWSLVQAFSCFFPSHCFHHLRFIHFVVAMMSKTLQIVPVAYHSFAYVDQQLSISSASWKLTQLCCILQTSTRDLLLLRCSSLSLSKTHSWAKLLDTQNFKFQCQLVAGPKLFLSFELVDGKIWFVTPQAKHVLQSRIKIKCTEVDGQLHGHRRMHFQMSGQISNIYVSEHMWQGSENWNTSIFSTTKHLLELCWKFNVNPCCNPRSSHILLIKPTIADLIGHEAMKVGWHIYLCHQSRMIHKSFPPVSTSHLAWQQCFRPSSRS